MPANFVPPRKAPATPEFEAWFTGSKVVDPSGGPLMVFHGTAHDFDTFEMAKQNSNYGEFRFPGREGFFFTSDPDEAEDVARWSEIHKGLSDKGGAGPNVKPVYLSIKYPYVRKSGGQWTQLWYDSNWEDLQAKCKKAGHDGMIIVGTGKAAGRSMYVAFSPNQIKSAIGNSGAFDPADARMTASAKTAAPISIAPGLVDAVTSELAQKLKGLAAATSGAAWDGAVASNSMWVDTDLSNYVLDEALAGFSGYEFKVYLGVSNVPCSTPSVADAGTYATPPGIIIKTTTLSREVASAPPAFLLKDLWSTVSHELSHAAQALYEGAEHYQEASNRRGPLPMAHPLEVKALATELCMDFRKWLQTRPHPETADKPERDTTIEEFLNADWRWSAIREQMPEAGRNRIVRDLAWVLDKSQGGGGAPMEPRTPVGSDGALPNPHRSSLRALHVAARRTAGDDPIRRRLTVSGFPVAIEYPAGSTKLGEDEEGKAWARVYLLDYGCIEGGPLGGDGETIDVYVGPSHDALQVFVVNQLKKDGSFDETKCMLGFTSLEEAKRGYLMHYPAGWENDRLGSIKTMGVAEFRTWLGGDGVAKAAAAPVQDPTESPAFKSWFSDSKVVDASGQPVVVYHGTDKKFRSFNPKLTTQGIIWFTNDRSAIEAGEVGAAGKGIILEMFAKISNPAGWKEYDQLMLCEFKHRGYDGAILPEKDGTFTGFVFDPAQLKSIKNKGTWDPGNKALMAADKQALLYQPKRTYRDYTLITVDVAAVEASYSQDSNFYVGAGGSGASIGNRYSQFQQWLKDNPDTPIDVPMMGLTPSGSIMFGDGRHRWAVLRDSGETRVAVLVPSSEVKRFQEQFGAEVVKGQVAKTARAIPLPSGAVGQILSILLDTILHHPPKGYERALLDGPEASKEWLNPAGRHVHAHPEWYDNEPIKLELVYVKFPKRSVGRFVVKGSLHDEGSAPPTIVVTLDHHCLYMVWDDADTYALRNELRSVVYHELTHLMDPRRHEYNTDRPSYAKGGLEYFNAPNEVRAFLQMIIKEVEDHLGVQRLPDVLPMEQLLMRSATWKRYNRHWNQDNRRYLIRNVALAVDDYLVRWAERKQKLKAAPTAP